MIGFDNTIFSILTISVIVSIFSIPTITIFSILTALSMAISTIVLAITGIFRGGGGGSPSKD